MCVCVCVCVYIYILIFTSNLYFCWYEKINILYNLQILPTDILYLAKIK